MIHFAAKIERNDPCWCGSGKKYKSCHMRFDEKIKSFQLKGHITPDRSIIKTPEQIQGINRDYRNIDRPTDVISFALADNKEETDYIPNELGDIFINIDAARRQAVDYEHSEKREICFLFTHGLLHLNGFDHQTPEEEKEMIKYQKMILDELVGQND